MKKRSVGNGGRKAIVKQIKALTIRLEAIDQIIPTWPAMLERMEELGMTRAEFCRKAKIAEAQMSRALTDAHAPDTLWIRRTDGLIRSHLRRLLRKTVGKERITLGKNLKRLKAGKLSP